LRRTSQERDARENQSLDPVRAQGGQLQGDPAAERVAHQRPLVMGFEHRREELRVPE
jgi:hypothetical protein